MIKQFKQRFVPMYHGFLNKIRTLVRGNPIVISNASDEPLVGLRVFGKSTQDGTPTPDAPVEIVSVENPTVNVDEQKLSVPYTIHGIPVTSGGNYTDANGQQWSCDEVDFERGVYVQRIKRYTFDISNVQLGTHSNGQKFYSTFLSMIGEGGVMSNRYFGSNWSRENNYAYVVNNSLVVNDNRFVDKDTAINLIQTERPEFLLLLNIPIETPLTADQIEAYKSLHTNEPNTTVYNDQGAWMEVGYITK